MRIGIVTSGGDCPGLNAVIRGAVLHGQESYGYSFTGFRGGWRGATVGDAIPLTRQRVRGISKMGGTIIGTSRTNPWQFGGEDAVKQSMERLGVDAVMAIGGDGTLAVAQRLHEAGISMVGVPKTIDNDLNATDMTFGFDTAVSIATDAMDRLADHWRFARSLHGGRGYGAERRLDRIALRHGRRRARDPDT